MALDPWYKIVTPRKEVRDGRSFSPDEFAIALEQIVAGSAPDDYRIAEQFFARTFFTRALREQVGIVLRRLSGRTANTAPVLTLVTQFGGGKTHALATLYHLAKSASRATEFPGVTDLLRDAGIAEVPAAEVGVFVGNAWDPRPGRETPWIDLAFQIARENGVRALGPSARTHAPGTDAIGEMFCAANAPVLILLDEVLNFVNRHREMADGFLAFVQNLTVAATASNNVAAVISLPRSQIEMTDWDQLWQERITKVVRRVTTDLLANDEAETSEVVRRRLFEDLGDDKVRKKVAKEYADWCFERTTRLPPEWTAVDSSVTESKARDILRSRFESCYPFHPATLSVFQRKWRGLLQFQQTRGTLAMLAQWISWGSREHFETARREPLITLGSAPLHIPEFRAVVLGQIGEARLDAAIQADISGDTCHARALDRDARGPLRDIHRRVGTAILFESSGGQVEKVAHLPELRFAIGEPDVETTSIDMAASTLEISSFFIRKMGTDGFRVHHQATLKKAVADRRASLDEETEIKPAVRRLVESEFARGANAPLVSFPQDSSAIQDSPRLTLVLVDPEIEWRETGVQLDRIRDWTQARGRSPRLYPASLIWCAKKQGRELRDSVELLLAWRRVEREVVEGILGCEYDHGDIADLRANVKDAENTAKDEVWSGYRFVALRDSRSDNGVKTIDLGAGHSSSSGTLCGRIIAALKTEALLNDSVGAGYIDRHWPPALKGSGAWPLTSLRQSFLDGTLTRLLEPDIVLRRKILEFVERGDFGLAFGARGDGYERVWFDEPIGGDEVAFESSMFLLSKAKAHALKTRASEVRPEPSNEDAQIGPVPAQLAEDERPRSGCGEANEFVLRIVGDVPAELWNRLGTKLLPKLGTGQGFRAGIDFTMTIEGSASAGLEQEVASILRELGIDRRVRVTREERGR